MSVQAIEGLRSSLRGQVITETDEGYEDARKVLNAMIERRPAVIVRCSETADVVAAVDFARENQLDVAVRGGGHSVPGFGTVDEGLVIDLAGMQSVVVDPERRTARAQGGATWGIFNDATHAHGLRPRAASSPRRASAGSPSAVASATSRAVPGCRATTSSRPRSSPPTGERSSRTRARTKTCSGRSGAAAGTSAS